MLIHCNYDTVQPMYGRKTNEFFRRLQDLNTHFNQRLLPTKLIQAVKPNDKHDSGIGSSSDLSTMKDHNIPLDATSMDATH